VKVVEGSEIYNFPVDHIVHFYSIFGRKSRSNKGTPSKLLPRARLPRACAAHLGIRAARAPSEVPSHLPNAARSFLTPRACRGRLECGAAVRFPGLPCGPSAVAGHAHSRGASVRPQVARRSARGVAALYHDAQPPPCRTHVVRRRPWGRPRRAPVAGRPQAK
jgi:hypothetical protein